MAKNSGYRSQKLAPASFKQGSGIRKKAGKKQGGYISFSLQPSASHLSGLILISACLMGISCRHDGTNALRKDVIKRYPNEILIPVCPEQLGGLPTPRPQAEIASAPSLNSPDFVTPSLSKRGSGGVVIDINGRDVTKEFTNGAYEVLKIVKFLNIKKAVLKEKSPSCGVKFIYRNAKLVNDHGITTRLLEENGVETEGVE